jgi:hypothetical protein
MFAYPKQTELNRVVPKAKIYAHSKPSKRVKELFVTQVGEIVWKYKLSPETINLPARNGINEIQVFEIALKAPDLDPKVLQAIEKAIPFPLICELRREDEIRSSVAYKRQSEADGSKWVIEALFNTGWRPIAAERSPLPVALNLATLYEQIVRAHIPLAARAGEGLSEHVSRFNTLQIKQKLQSQLQSRLAQENQFNRKVELNAQLRELTAELATLQHS